MPEKRKGLEQYYESGKILFGNDPKLIPTFMSSGIKELDELSNNR